MHAEMRAANAFLSRNERAAIWLSRFIDSLERWPVDVAAKQMSVAPALSHIAPYEATFFALASSKASVMVCAACDWTSLLSTVTSMMLILPWSG